MADPSALAARDTAPAVAAAMACRWSARASAADVPSRAVASGWMVPGAPVETAWAWEAPVTPLAPPAVMVVGVPRRSPSETSSPESVARRTLTTWPIPTVREVSPAVTGSWLEPLPPATAETLPCWKTLRPT